MNDLDQQLRDAGARLRATAPTPEATEGALEGLSVIQIDQHPHRRRRMVTLAAVAVAAAAAAVVGVVVLNRPSDDPVVSTGTTEAPDVETTTPSTTPSTTPTTISSPPPAAETWSSAPLPGFGVVNCCGANATGPASPEFTPDGQPLADGYYWANVSEWSGADPARLGISVRRLVPCADGVDECSPYADGTYGADEVGLSDDERALEVALDPSVAVELTGVDPTSANGVHRRSDGTALAELLSALAASYDELIGGPVSAGTLPETVVADLRANPRGGFTRRRTTSDSCTSAMATRRRSCSSPWRSRDDANVLHPLPRSGTGAVDLIALEVRDGALILYFYAGFIS